MEGVAVSITNGSCRRLHLRFSELTRSSLIRITGEPWSNSTLIGWWEDREPVDKSSIAPFQIK